MKKAFFSDSETDGTFMLTGDRTYYVNNQARSETFYILFCLNLSGNRTTVLSVNTVLLSLGQRFFPLALVGVHPVVGCLEQLVEGDVGGHHAASG